MKKPAFPTVLAARGGPKMPSGALGLWFARNYSSAVRKHIPNSATATPVQLGLLPSSTNHPFQVLTPFSATETRRFATGPLGVVASATRYLGTGNCYFSAIKFMSVGTWTMGFHAMTNSGSSEDFRYGDLTDSDISSGTATTTWQRFSKTFTISIARSTEVIFGWSKDGSTGWDLLIDNAQIFPGSVDLGADTPAGHAYFDDNPLAAGGTTSPSTGIVDVSSSGSAVMQFPQTSVSTFTAGAMVRRTSATEQFYSAIFSAPVLGYGVLTQYLSNGAKTGAGTFGNSTSFVGPWELNGNGWHVITHRYDGAYYSIWFDDTLVHRAASSTAPKSLDALLMFSLNSLGVFSTPDQFNAAFFYPSALTDSQIRTQLVPSLRSVASADGLTLSPTTRFVVAEGDSITESATSYYIQSIQSLTKPVSGKSFAVSGSTISDLLARAPGVDVVFPGSGKKILTVLIGANGLMSYPGGTDAITAQNWVDALSAYTDARRAVGWKVAVCTVLPYGATGGANTFNTIRNLVNPLIRSNVGVHWDAVIDFDTDAQMGIDNSYGTYPANWTDTVHPATAGHTRLYPIYLAAVEAIQ